MTLVVDFDVHQDTNSLVLVTLFVGTEDGHTIHQFANVSNKLNLSNKKSNFHYILIKECNDCLGNECNTAPKKQQMRWRGVDDTVST